MFLHKTLDIYKTTKSHIVYIDIKQEYELCMRFGGFYFLHSVIRGSYHYGLVTLLSLYNHFLSHPLMLGNDARAR